MILLKTIEIDEIETEVMIDFTSHFGEVEISKITDVKTGDALGLEVDDYTFNELREYAADMAAERHYTRYNYDY